MCACVRDPVARRELSARGLALYSLSADVVEMIVGLGVLFQCLRPYFPLPQRWFPISLKGKWPKVGRCGLRGPRWFTVLAFADFQRLETKML
jgi:hypothetical protein